MYSKALVLAALAASASAQMPALLPRKTTAASDSEATSTSPECLSRIQSWSGAIPTPAPALQDAMENNADGSMAESGLPGLCDFGAALPKAQASAFTSYNLDMYSYLSAQSSNLVALAATCSDDMGAPSRVITSQLEELLTVYSSFSAGACKVEATTTAADATTTTGTAGKTTVTSASASATVKVGAASGASGAASSTLITSTADNPAATASDAVSSVASAASSIISSATATPTQNAGARETGMHAMAALAVGLIGAAVAL